jgi:hypothetical protein
MIDASHTYMDRYPSRVPPPPPAQPHGQSTFRDRTYDLSVANRGRDVAANAGILEHILSYLGDPGHYPRRQHGQVLRQARAELVTNPTGAAPTRRRPSTTPRASRKRKRSLMDRPYTEVD